MIIKNKHMGCGVPNKSNSRRPIHPEFKKLYQKQQGIERFYKTLKEDRGFNKFYFNKSDKSADENLC